MHTHGPIMFAVGTGSMLKVNAIKAALRRFEAPRAIVKRHNVDSGVGIQPIGLVDTTQGARNRAESTYGLSTDASVCLGIESGLVEIGGCWFDVACVVAIKNNQDRTPLVSTAYSAHLPIPTWLAEKVIREKTELAEAVGRLQGGYDPSRKDVMKYLCNSVLTREELLVQAIVCALIPLICTTQYDGEPAPR